MPPISDESHIVREGVKTPVRLTPFGWFVVATLGGSIGLLGAALALYSMRIGL